MIDKYSVHALANREMERRAADLELPVPLANRLRGLLPRPYILGVDVNRFTWNHPTDLKQAYAAGYRFAIVETAWGLWQPPSFAETWKPWLDAGFLLLGYGFFRGDQKGSDQADFLLDCVFPMYEAQGFWMPLFGDVEPFTGDPSTVPNRQTNWKAWCDTIRAEVRPGVYSSQYYWRLLMKDMAIDPDVLTWVAHYADTTAPLTPPGWSDQLHQVGIAGKYSWTPLVPGINGTMDVDRFYGTLAELEALKSNEVKPEEPPSPPSADWQAIFDAMNTINVKMDTVLSNQADMATQHSWLADMVDEALTNTRTIIDKLDGLDDLPDPPDPQPQAWQQIKVTRDPVANAFKIVGDFC